MTGTRSALIVANSEYADAELRQLRAPASDAEALGAVLRDPDIGHFDVRTLLNAPAHEVNLAVEEFFADRQPDDLLLMHFSCHGIKDADGELYFATANTALRTLAATAVSAAFVNGRMSRSRSRRVVLLLDCCYAGAFERGMTARASAEVGVEAQFAGRGRAVITASSAMEYAFESAQLADTLSPGPSVFTSALVEGLATGDADRDQDGLIALDELYDYVYEKVREATPNQTPSKWAFGVQGELVIARRSRPVTAPAQLPHELEDALVSPFASIRAGAVQELGLLLNSRHAGLALAARLALERMTDDDSRTVAAAATTALGEAPEPAPEEAAAPPPEPALELAAEPAPEPAPEQAADPAPEPAPQLAAEPAPEQAAEPAPEPVAAGVESTAPAEPAALAAVTGSASAAPPAAAPPVADKSEPGEPTAVPAVAVATTIGEPVMGQPTAVPAPTTDGPTAEPTTDGPTAEPTVEPTTDGPPEEPTAEPTGTVQHATVPPATSPGQPSAGVFLAAGFVCLGIAMGSIGQALLTENAADIPTWPWVLTITACVLGAAVTLGGIRRSLIAGTALLVSMLWLAVYATSVLGVRHSTLASAVSVLTPECVVGAILSAGLCAWAVAATLRGSRGVVPVVAVITAAATATWTLSAVAFQSSTETTAPQAVWDTVGWIGVVVTVLSLLAAAVAWRSAPRGQRQAQG